MPNQETQFEKEDTILALIHRTREEAEISILSFPFTRKPMPLTLSRQAQIALASLRS